MEERNFLLILFILLINFLSMIFMVFKLEEKFMFEFVILIIFLMIAFIMTVGIYFEELWAWRISMVFFVASIMNIFYLLSYTANLLLSAIVVILSFLGFFTAFVNIRTYEPVKAEENIQKEIPMFDAPAAAEAPIAREPVLVARAAVRKKGAAKKPKKKAKKAKPKKKKSAVKKRKK